MDPLFSCPPPTYLADIPAQTCPENFGQIQRIAFQRRQATPSFTTTTIKAEATWTPLLTASDETKVVVSPFLPGLVIPAGEIIKEGGNDNTTINGIPRLVGRGFVAVTGQAQSLEKAVRAAFRALGSESALLPGFTNLWAYFINQYGQIISNADGSGIDIYNLMMGDTGSEGLNKLNVNNYGFDLAPGWSDNIVITSPTAPFKPLNLA